MTNLAVDLLSVGSGIVHIDLDQQKRCVDPASRCSASMPPEWRQPIRVAWTGWSLERAESIRNGANRTGNQSPPAKLGTPGGPTRRRRTDDPETGKCSPHATIRHQTGRRTEQPSLSGPFSPSNPG
jgi:hypothetical protein